MIKFMITKLTIVFTTMKQITAILLAALSIFAPVAPIIHGVLILILFDVITGIMAHFKSNKIKFKFWRAESWRHITSRKLGNTISKILVYLILIICGFVIDTFIIKYAVLYFTKFLSGAIAVREIKSLIENAELILGGGLIKTIRSFIQGGFKKGLTDAFEEKHKPKDE